MNYHDIITIEPGKRSDKPCCRKRCKGGMEIITVSELERRLNKDVTNKAQGIKCNFFSNLSSSVQQTIKNTPVTIPSGTSPYTAFLLADSFSLINQSSVVNTNTSIWHSSFAKDSTFQPRIFTEFCSTQVASGKIDIAHTSSFKMGIDQASITQISTIQNSITQISSCQINSTEIGSIQGSLPKISLSKGA